MTLDRGFPLLAAVGCALILVALPSFARAELLEVGVEWINVCHPCGNADLGGRDDCAMRFYNKLVSHGAIGRFHWGNAAAWEQDFKYASAPGGGTDNYWVDTVDVVMHADHGGPGIFGFGEDNHDTCILWSSRARWGDQDLEWMILDDCSCLYNGDGDAFNRWRDAFQGLHLILSFYTGAHDTSTRGDKLATKLLDGWRFTTAWRYACEQTEGGSTRGAVMGVGMSGGDWSFNDHLWGHGSVSPDMPPASGRYLWLWNFPCD
ncbi:MAG: hypothetical protein J7M26_08155 [Armatimonadetes bacterium]|nr:hypothetical protein [Armatimonadota bacterium]